MCSDTGIHDQPESATSITSFRSSQPLEHILDIPNVIFKLARLGLQAFYIKGLITHLVRSPSSSPLYISGSRASLFLPEKDILESGIKQGLTTQILINIELTLMPVADVFLVADFIPRLWMPELSSKAGALERMQRTMYSRYATTYTGCQG